MANRFVQKQVCLLQENSFWLLLHFNHMYSANKNTLLELNSIFRLLGLPCPNQVYVWNLF